MLSKPLIRGRRAWEWVLWGVRRDASEQEQQLQEEEQQAGWPKFADSAAPDAERERCVLFTLDA